MKPEVITAWINALTPLIPVVGLGVKAILDVVRAGSAGLSDSEIADGYAAIMANTEIRLALARADAMDESANG